MPRRNRRSELELRRLDALRDIVNATQQWARVRQGVIASKAKLSQGHFSRILSGTEGILATYPRIVAACETLLKERGCSEEMFKELFGAVNLSEFRFESERLPPLAITRDHISQEFERILYTGSFGWTIPHRIAHLDARIFLRMAKLLPRLPDDLALRELTYRAATQFIVQINSYPPLPGHYWHNRAATIGTLVMKLIERPDDVETFRLGWATSLAYHAAQRLTEAQSVLSTLVASSDLMPKDFCAIITTDYARLLNSMGAHRTARTQARVAFLAAQEADDPFRLFISKQAEGLANASLSEYDEAEDCLDESKLRDLGVDESQFSRIDRLAIELERALVAGARDKGAHGREEVIKLTRKQLKESQNEKSPLHAVASERNKLISILTRDVPNDVAVTDALLYRVREVVPPDLTSSPQD